MGKETEGDLTGVSSQTGGEKKFEAVLEEKVVQIEMMTKILNDKEEQLDNLNDTLKEKEKQLEMISLRLKEELLEGLQKNNAELTAMIEERGERERGERE